MSKLNVVEVYDYLHTIPELGFEEVKTSSYLAQKLQEFGYKVTTGVGKTGVIGEMKGAESGPVVLVRADMDALPFVVDGKPEARHACGHDSHCAMIICAAEALADKVKRGTLKIMFQPGEETLKGALSVIADGALEGVDYALGLHIRPVQDIPDGTLSPAIKHASSTFVTIEVEGRGCHGARPHLGVNAVETAALITTAIMGIKCNPALAWSCKVTGIQGGFVAPNIIPEKAKLIVDVRAQTNELMDELLEKLTRAAKGAGEAMGAQVAVTTPGGVIPAAELNDEVTQMLKECILETVGEEKTRPELLNPGGEDFHYFARKYPKLKAGYFAVGAGATPGLHDVNMQLNKYSLEPGVEVMVKAVQRLLG